MDRWVNRVALVTGASYGIGKGIAEMLASSGLKVVACARSLDKLEAMSKEHPNITAYKCDLTNKHEIDDMFKFIDSSLGGVDVCVANAGTTKTAKLLESDYDTCKELLDLNVLALTYCVQLSLKSMMRRNVDDGQIFLMGSTSAHRVGANRFYAATKHAVRALQEGFRLELRELGSHIRVCCLSMGHTDTPLIERLYGGKLPVELLKVKDITDTVKFVMQTPKHVEVNDILMRPVEHKL